MRLMSWLLLFSLVIFQNASADEVKAPLQNAAAANGSANDTATAVNGDPCTPTKEPADQPPSATLIEPASGAVQMGGTLEIKVSGRHQITIADARASSVWLVLDNVIMKSLGPPLAQRCGDSLLLSFYLSRDAENMDSRTDWKNLLERQHDGYLMTLPVALAIGNSPILPVATRNAGTFRFYITTQQRVWGTVVAGLLIFFLMYWWLATCHGALRDYTDGPFSLGKSQMAFWGLLVVLTFGGVWVNTGLIEHIPQQVLILLGISAGTGLSSIVIGNGTKASEIARLEGEKSKLSTSDPEYSARVAELDAKLEKLRNPTKYASRSF